MARSAAVLLGRDEAADAARIAENIAQSVGHIDHAAAILQNIRSFLAKGAPEKAPTDMRLLVQQVMSLVSRQQNMAQGRLQGAFDEALPELQCDALQIQQVLINLVQNAIDADAAANIELSVRRGTEGLLFRVQDNGPGIEEGLRDRIFDPLLTSRKHGLGLGLPICRAIIEAHDGRLWLESTRPGRTVFCFTLPT
jgi:two-component system sensor kinase FixL